MYHTNLYESVFELAKKKHPPSIPEPGTWVILVILAVFILGYELYKYRKSKMVP